MSIGWIPRLVCSLIGAAAIATTTPWRWVNLILWFVGGIIAVFPLAAPWPDKGKALTS